jgi:hypothetical protein
MTTSSGKCGLSCIKTKKCQKFFHHGTYCFVPHAVGRNKCGYAQASIKEPIGFAYVDVDAAPHPRTVELFLVTRDGGSYRGEL